jgi:hypothetical protein
MSKSPILITAGGRIRCPRCQAKAKRTGQQCLRPALRGKRVCRFHGGASTGPKTQVGRDRCAKARLVHGRETTAIREERSHSSARLAVLEWAGHTLGFMEGPRTRGPKPAQLAEALPELQEAVRRILIRKLGKDGN